MSASFRPLKIGILLIVGALGLALLVVLLAETLLRQAIERIGTEQAHVAVTVRDVRLALWQGRVAVHELAVANPPGYQTPFAMTVDSITVTWDWPSLATNPLILNEVVIDGPDISFEGSLAHSNLETIWQNLRHTSHNGEPSPSHTPVTSRSFVIHRLAMLHALVQVRLATGSIESSLQRLHLKPMMLEHLGNADHPLSPADLATLVFTTFTDRMMHSLGAATGGLLERSVGRLGTP